MKNTSAALFAAILCIAFSSCNKDKNANANANFTAKIDGTSFNASTTSATRALGVIAIEGQSADGGIIVLRMADSGVHKYTMGIGSSSNAGAYTITNNIAFTTNAGNDATQSGGTVTITAIDTANKKLSGTFSMKVYRPIDQTQKEISEGTFSNISYETSALPPANAKDTFRVKIDGADFSVASITGIVAINKINISGSNSDVSKTVGLSFPTNITAGSYTFTSFGSDYIGQYNVGSSYLSADSGTLTILENNTSTKRIRGNFNFGATEFGGSQTATLTQGYFSVVYQ